MFLSIASLSSTSLIPNYQKKNERVLSFGLEHSFVDKNKNIKSFLAANLEGVAESTDKAVGPIEKENFHEFLCANTDIFTKNVHNTKDFTYHDLKGSIRNDDTVLVSGDKESCVVITRKTDYKTRCRT